MDERDVYFPKIDYRSMCYTEYGEKILESEWHLLSRMGQDNRDMVVIIDQFLEEKGIIMDRV